MTEQQKKIIIIILKILLYALGLILGGLTTSVTAQTLFTNLK